MNSFMFCTSAWIFHVKRFMEPVSNRFDSFSMFAKFFKILF